MTKTVKFKNAYSPSEKVQYSSKLPSRTKQAPHAECDINQIMSKYQKTGIIEHVQNRPGSYESFIGATDYHTSMNMILEAQESFNLLPSSVRARFENDPGAFLAFVQDPANHEEMGRMGLLHDYSPAEQRAEPEDAPASPAPTEDTPDAA